MNIILRYQKKKKKSYFRIQTVTLIRIIKPTKSFNGKYESSRILSKFLFHFKVSQSLGCFLKMNRTEREKRPVGGLEMAGCQLEMTASFSRDVIQGHYVATRTVI